MLHNKYFKIMKHFLKGYNKEIYGRALINLVTLSQKNISLTLLELEKEGILFSKLSGNRKYYSVNFLNPLIRDHLALFESFRKIEFLEKNKKMIDISKKIEGEVVCIFGSYAKETQDKDSDLDIFVVGKINSQNLRKLGEEYGYSIQIFNLSLIDFKKELQKKNPLVLEILENHVLLKGQEVFVEEVLNG